MKGDEMGILSKMKWGLLASLIVMLVLVACSVFVPDMLNNAAKWVANNDSASKIRELTQQKVIGEDTQIETVVEGIFISKISYKPVVILMEKGRSTSGQKGR